MAFAGKRITINLSDEDHLQLTKLAQRSQTSLSQLGQFAIKHLLARSEEALPLLPKTLDDELPVVPWTEYVWTQEELDKISDEFPTQEHVDRHFEKLDESIAKLNRLQNSI